MTPVSPVVKGFEHLEVTFAKNQPEYNPLPALPVDDAQRIITRWHPTWRERIQLILGQDIYLWISTFGRPLQPVAIVMDKPSVSVQNAAT